jgi:site-specific recombinase XerD
MRKVQIHLGHADIHSTQLYAHLLSSEIQWEIYDLYSRVRTPDFFESEGAIAI